jgi:WD40 repeat protein
VFAGTTRLLHAPPALGISVHALPSLDEVSALHHGGCCQSVAVSPDGKLAAGSDERKLLVWEIGTRKLVARVNGAHREDISSLAFSADGRHLATGSKDTTVLLWDVAKLTLPERREKVEAKLVGDAAKRFFEPGSLYYGIKADGTLDVVRAGSKLKPPPLKGVTRVASGGISHCAISEGKVRCWGSTYGGALGVAEQHIKPKGGYAEVAVPTTVPVKDPVDLRMTGSYACALERGGDLVCWGRFDHGKPVLTPGKVLGGVKSFDLVLDQACATGTDGVVRCWDRKRDAPEPLAVKDAVSAASGYAHTCILDKGGAVHCKGSNSSDQLGDDTGVDQANPVVVRGVQGAVAAAVGRYATCAVDGSGAVFCWGSIGAAHLERATRIAALGGAKALRIDLDSVCGLVGDKALCVTMTMDAN